MQLLSTQESIESKCNQCNQIGRILNGISYIIVMEYFDVWIDKYIDVTYHRLTHCGLMTPCSDIRHRFGLGNGLCLSSLSQFWLKAKGICILATSPKGHDSIMSGEYGNCNFIILPHLPAATESNNVTRVCAHRAGFEVVWTGNVTYILRFLHWHFGNHVFALAHWMTWINHVDPLRTCNMMACIIG